MDDTHHILETAGASYTKLKAPHQQLSDLERPTVAVQQVSDTQRSVLVDGGSQQPEQG